MQVRTNKKIAVPHLVQYQGSKRSLAPIIAQYFPEKIKRMVEPFSGTCAVSIYAASHQLAQSFWLNDINSQLIDMLRDCVHNPEKLVKEYTEIWNGQFEEGTNNVDYYYEKRDEFNSVESNSALTLFILARVSKGAIRYNSEGKMNQMCDKRRFGTKPEGVYKNAKMISDLLFGKSLFTSVDYKEVLKLTVPGDLVYLDPPYQGVTSGLSSRYIQSIDHDEFCSELAILNDRGIDFIVSYDGQTGNKKFGRALPASLNLKHLLIDAGRSSQATLNGKVATTYESLYISQNLMEDE